MAEQLYEVAAEFAQLRGHERVFDLYCGIGTIGLTLAARAREVVGVEIVEPAVADAIENARLNDVLNARFYAGDIRLAMRDLVEQAGRPDVAVVDPPRAGLSQKVVRRILEAQPSRIVYVSCNPTTLAPNAAQMVEAGYRLVRVRPVDMFPQTPHIESVALLERGLGGAGANVGSPNAAERAGDLLVRLDADGHAAVRGADLDELVGGAVEAGAPVDDAVGARVDARCSARPAGRPAGGRRGTARSTRRAGSSCGTARARDRSRARRRRRPGAARAGGRGAGRRSAPRA